MDNIAGPPVEGDSFFLGDPKAEDWTAVADEVLILIRQLEVPWLIYVDELPIFLFWEQRLFMQLPKADARHAVVLLTKAAARREGAKAQLLLAMLHERMPHASEDEVRQTFIRLRDILQRDAYWGPDDRGKVRRYRFLLEPLRRWWWRRNRL